MKIRIITAIFASGKPTRSTCCTGSLICGRFTVVCSNSFQLRWKAELVSGLGAVTSMRIAVHKLRTCHASGQHDDYRDCFTQRDLWVYSPSSQHTWWVFIQCEYCSKSMGVRYDTTPSAEGNQLAPITRQVHCALESAASLSEYFDFQRFPRLPTMGVDDTKRLDFFFAREYNRISEYTIVSQHKSHFQLTSTWWT